MDTWPADARVFSRPDPKPQKRIWQRGWTTRSTFLTECKRKISPLWVFAILFYCEISNCYTIQTRKFDVELLWWAFSQKQLFVPNLVVKSWYSWTPLIHLTSNQTDWLGYYELETKVIASPPPPPLPLHKGTSFQNLYLGYTLQLFTIGHFLLRQ